MVSRYYIYIERDCIKFNFILLKFYQWCHSDEGLQIYKYIIPKCEYIRQYSDDGLVNI